MDAAQYKYRVVRYIFPLPPGYPTLPATTLEAVLNKPWSEFEDELDAHLQGWWEHGYEIVSHSTATVGPNLLVSVLLRMPR